MSKVGLSDYIKFDPSIIRGFDYYTGFIFEVFDTDPANKRSLYGGGRYDNLIGLFSNEELSGIGFGLGDVTLENFLKTHKLIPEIKKYSTFFIPLLDENLFSEIQALAKSLRAEKISCEVSLDSKQKFGKQLANAEKKGYRYILILGQDEIEKNTINLKDLSTGEQKSLSRDSLLDELKTLI